MSVLTAQPALQRFDTRSSLISLTREPGFYRGAWNELLPSITALIEDLVHQHQFIRVAETADHMTIRNETTLIDIPFAFDLPKQHIMSRDQGGQSVVSFFCTHLEAPESNVLPIVDIARFVQCILPGQFHVIDTLIPPVDWLIKYELMLREAFGDSYFRHLCEAAEGVNL